MTEFRNILREWRGIRRFSQLQFATETGISARHISFLETGRARPSRGMILRLSEALEMPRATVNEALLSAGFAPTIGPSPARPEDLAPILGAIERLLERHMPFPAIAFDSGWDVRNANSAALGLLSEAGLGAETNLAGALITAAGMDILENWEEVAWLSAARLRTDLRNAGRHEGLADLLHRLTDLPRFRAIDPAEFDMGRAMIPAIFCIGHQRLSLFSTIAQFGTVQEVSLSEIQIELMFPADDATRMALQANGSQEI